MTVISRTKEMSRDRAGARLDGVKVGAGLVVVLVDRLLIAGIWIADYEPPVKVSKEMKKRDEAMKEVAGSGRSVRSSSSSKSGKEDEPKTRATRQSARSASSK